MVTYHFWKFHEVLGRGLRPSPKKVAHNWGSLAQNRLEKAIVASMPCCGSDWRASVTCVTCNGSGWGSSSTKCHVVLGVRYLEGLVVRWRFYISWGRSDWLCFVSSTSLTIHGDLNHIIVASRHMFTPVEHLAEVNVGGGCYRVVSDHGSPIKLDGRNVLVMHTCRLDMCSLWLWFMCLFCMHGGGHGCSCVTMWKLMVLLLEVVVMSVCRLCICYACQCLYIIIHTLTWL